MTPPIADLWPSPRTVRQNRALNILRRRHIATLDDLTQHSARDLLLIRGFGLASLAEVLTALDRHSLTLATDQTARRPNGATTAVCADRSVSDFP
jgi:DNA-directed RNA polymerase alpha subunit